jgi:deoxyribodipyrimidine photolyase-related protein
MKRILYVPFDQLHRRYGILKNANPQEDLIVMVESKRMTTGDQWHKVRLYYLISSSRHFAEELKTEGFTVHFVQAETTEVGLKKIQESENIPIYACEQSSYRLTKSLENLGATFLENDFFLTPRKLFFQWAEKQKSFIMENFYRAQRIRLEILVEGEKPVGGEWNFDKENRLPPPKNYTFPPYLTHSPDSIDTDVAHQLHITPPTDWATSRSGALKVLKNFLDNHFSHFGPYEDAMTTENWALHHSLLSPYINNGLLHPSEVIAEALKRYKKGDIPIASCEGFIRQIIGWREYINGMYWFLGEKYKENNNLSAHRKLLPLFTNSASTKMNCVKNIISDIENRAWTHHIPRLMVLSNLALITGTNPQEFLDWMRRTFIDASDWVMVPNVIGMGLHADNGKMMTKPYAAGGAYISRMSNYCSQCSFDPKLRTGETACPFTTLYWDFLDRHKESFKKNHRMSQQVFGIGRLKDLPELKERAKEVLTGLDLGII